MSINEYLRFAVKLAIGETFDVFPFIFHYPVVFKIKVVERNMDSESTNNLVEPVYFKNSDVPIEGNRWLTTFEICTACELVINPEITPDNKVRYTEAAQKIGDFWRIYLNDDTARVNLLLQGITLRGMHIELKDKNPFLKPGFEGFKTTRLFIRNVPMSFANAEIDKYLKSKGVEMVNDMKYARARDPNGKLTNF